MKSLWCVLPKDAEIRHYENLLHTSSQIIAIPLAFRYCRLSKNYQIQSLKMQASWQTWGSHFNSKYKSRISSTLTWVCELRIPMTKWGSRLTWDPHFYCNRQQFTESITSTFSLIMENKFSLWRDLRDWLHPEISINSCEKL